MTIYDQIKEELQTFEETDLDKNPSFAKSQKEVIELTDYYLMSRYRDGDADSSGFKKGFYNIIEQAVQVAAKMIDIDTKDVRLIAEDGASYYPAWLMSKELDIWMKDERNQDYETFGQFLNTLVENYPKYGHLLVKKAKGTAHLVPLQTLVVDQEAKNFMDSDYIIEVHEYTPEQLRKQAWDKNKIEQAINKYGEEGTIMVYERHGEMTGKKDNYFIITGSEKDADIVFYKDNRKREEMYKELKWDDVAGRAMGRGQAEKLFENQIAKNILENLIRTSLRWTSKQVFQTRDNTVNKNILTDVENGELLTVQSEITKVEMEERNLSAYQVQDQKWDKNTADKAFVQDILQGQRPPAGTPLGTSVLQAKMAGAYYDLKREKLGMLVREILMDWILPQFKSKKKPFHIFMNEYFSEEELDKFQNLIIQKKFNKALLNGKRIPNANERQILKGIITDQVKSQKEMKIPEGFYENIKYKVEVVVTDERIDLASKVNVIQSLLLIVGQNPTVLQNPNSKKLLYQLMDLVGISPVGFEPEPMGLGQIAQAQQAKVGGSIAAPSRSMQPATTNVQTAL